MRVFYTTRIYIINSNSEMKMPSEQNKILKRQMSHKRLPDNILHENMLFQFMDNNLNNQLGNVQYTNRWKIKYSEEGIDDLYLEIVIGKYTYTDTYVYKWVHEKYLRTVHDEDFLPFLYEEKEYVNDCTTNCNSGRPGTINPKPNTHHQKIEEPSNTLGFISWTYEGLRKLFS